MFKDKVRITDPDIQAIATVNENSALVIQDLEWLKNLCNHIGANLLSGAHLRIKDSNTGDVFSVCYLGKDYLEND